VRPRSATRRQPSRFRRRPRERTGLDSATVIAIAGRDLEATEIAAHALEATGIAGRAARTGAHAPEAIEIAIETAELGRASRRTDRGR